ncbi:hypothetical protein [Thermogutta sp.]|uniref:hypothetical protein n=1 Tax=Thermogutta sp. TaxID=1962930 RepID=UPI003220225E
MDSLMDPSPAGNPEVGTKNFEMLAKTRFDASGYPALRRLTCHCDGKRLFIRGSVPNYYHKQLAQSSLSDLSEELEIVNETLVEVRPTLPQTRHSVDSQL